MVTAPPETHAAHAHGQRSLGGGGGAERRAHEGVQGLHHQLDAVKSVKQVWEVGTWH